MSKLAHSNDETMAEIEARALAAPPVNDEPSRLPREQEYRLRGKLAYCSGVLSASADVIEHQFPEMAKLLRKASGEADTTLSETRT